MSLSPEQIIQTAWVNRAREEMEDQQAQGLAYRSPHWPPWMPEVAVQALLKEGWTPPACGCGPTEDERAFAETGERINAMPLEAFNEMFQELWEKGEGGV